jgi:hypothetical protein
MAQVDTNSGLSEKKVMNRPIEQNAAYVWPRDHQVREKDYFLQLLSYGRIKEKINWKKLFEITLSFFATENEKS